MVVLELIANKPAWRDVTPLVQSSQKFWIFKCALKQEYSDIVSFLSLATRRYPAVGSKVHNNYYFFVQGVNIYVSCWKLNSFMRTIWGIYLSELQFYNILPWGLYEDYMFSKIQFFNILPWGQFFNILPWGLNASEWVFWGGRQATSRLERHYCLLILFCICILFRICILYFCMFLCLYFVFWGDRQP